MPPDKLSKLAKTTNFYPFPDISVNKNCKTMPSKIESFEKVRTGFQLTGVAESFEELTKFKVKSNQRAKGLISTDVFQKFKEMYKS